MGEVSEGGKNGAPQEPDETRDRDPQTGYFLSGNEIGKLGGRPPKKDFVTMVEKAARDAGEDPDGRVWKVVERMFQAAEDGDVGAMKVVLDRWFGSVDKAVVAVNVDARSSTAVPVAPTGDDWRKWVKRFGEVAEERGILSDVASDDSDTPTS